MVRSCWFFVFVVIALGPTLDDCAGEIVVLDETVDVPINAAPLAVPAAPMGLPNPNLEQLIEQRTERFKRHIALQIEDLTRVCDLSDRQVKKLEIAGKGSIEEVIQRWKKQVMAQQQGQFQAAPPILEADIFAAPALPRAPVAPPRVPPPSLEVPADEQPLPEVDPAIPPRIEEADEARAEPPDGQAAGAYAEPEAEVGLIDQPVHFVQVLQAPALHVWQAGAITVNPDEATSTALWRRTVDRVLSDEQKEAYRASKEERKLRRRKSLADRVATELDQSLLLTGLQRTRLTQLILTTLNDQLDKMFPPQAFLPDAALAAQVSSQIPREKLVGILDEAQIESWGDSLNNQQQPFVFFNGIAR